MSAGLLWALTTLALAIVLVRRRSAAIGLLALQSLLLGVAAATADGPLWVAGSVLVVRGIALPALLAALLRRTREPSTLARLLLAVAVAIAAAALTPDLGLTGSGSAQAAMALVALGICTVALRRRALTQLVGVLVAENGVYLAGLAVPGGVPIAIELALLLDLVAVLAVAAAFGDLIHRRFGTSDTALLRGLRD